MIHILTGFGVLVALLTSVAQQYLAQKAEGGGARPRLRERLHGTATAEGDGPPDG